MTERRIQNLLYDHPEYYELVYPEPNEETPNMCRRMFARFLRQAPTSILDIGCGTGRDLAALTRDGAEGWGVDTSAQMIAFAQHQRPRLRLQTGDMRSVRLGRVFDAILCMGSAFMYALSNDEIAQTLNTFVAHARPGTLLILDINNAAHYLGGGFEQRMEKTVVTPQFTARTIATHSFDRRRQLLIRRRVWEIPGRSPIEDYCEYRLLFPAELDGLLLEHGFRVAGMYDNMDLRETDLSGRRLYIAAIRESGDITITVER